MGHYADKSKYNLSVQYYKGVPLRLIQYTEEHFSAVRAKRFMIHGSTQNIWVPNTYLEPDGTIKATANLDWLFSKAKEKHKLELAGITFDPKEGER